MQEVIDKLAASWNAGDGLGWAAPFAADAVLVDVLGRVQRGRDVIAQEHQKTFDTIYQGSRLSIRLVASRPVGGDLVLAHTTSELTVPSGPRAGTTQAVQTTLLRGGLIEAFHNTIRIQLAQFAGDDADLAALSPMDRQDTTGG